MLWKIGRKIIKLRKDENITQVELANKLHIGEKALRKIENNITPIRLDLLADICEIFNIEIIKFFDDFTKYDGECNCEMREKILTIVKIINDE